MSTPDQLNALLQEFYSPSLPTTRRTVIQQQLDDIKRRAWFRETALVCFRDGVGSVYLQFFALSALQEHVRWQSSATEQANTVSTLASWLLAQKQSLPLPVANKGAQVLAVAAITGSQHTLQQLLQQAAACLQDAGTVQVACLILTCLVDELRHAASCQSGQVLSATASHFAQQFKELQPALLHLLTACLERMLPSLEPVSPVLGMPAVLILLKRLLEANPGTCQVSQGLDGGLLASLFRIAHLPYRHPGGPAEMRQAATAALDCIQEILSCNLLPEEAEQLLGAALQGLQALCAAVVAGCASSGSSSGALDPHSLASLVRVVTQLITAQLPRIQQSAALMDRLDALLVEVFHLTYASRSLAHFLLLAEVYASLADTLAGQLDACQEAADPQAAQQQWRTRAFRYQGHFQAVFNTVLEGCWFARANASPAHVSPPMVQLSMAEGSGAALADLLSPFLGTATDDPEAADSAADGSDGLDAEALPEDSEAGTASRQYLALAGQLLAVCPDQLTPMAWAAFSTACNAFLQGPAGAAGTLLDLIFALQLSSKLACHLPASGPEADHRGSAMDLILQCHQAWWASWRQAQLPPHMLDAAGAALLRTLSAWATIALPAWLALPHVASNNDVSEAAKRTLHAYVDAALSACVAAAESPAIPVNPNVLTAGAQSLLALSSVPLSSACRPPAAVLELLLQHTRLKAAVTMIPALLFSGSAAVLPLPAARMLYVAFSDLLLRSWSHLRAEHHALLAASSAAYSGLIRAAMAPLEAAGAVPAQARQLEAARVSAAAAVLTDVIRSFTGAPKPVRQVLYDAGVARALPAAIALLQALPGSGHVAAHSLAEALLDLIAACMDVLPGEAGAAVMEETIRRLLDVCTVSASATAADFWLAVHRALLLVLVSVASAPGSRSNRWVAPVLQVCLGMAGAALAESEPQQGGAAAHALTGMAVALLRVAGAKWQLITSPAWQQEAGAAAAAALQVHQLAAGCLQRQGDAARERVDVRPILEELAELPDKAWAWWAQPSTLDSHCRLLAALHGLLRARMHTGVQDELLHVLYLAASANWQAYSEVFLPGELARCVGAAAVHSEELAVARRFQGTHMDEPTFAQCTVALVNDILWCSQRQACLHERTGD